jgi:hypothetical protein
MIMEGYKKQVCKPGSVFLTIPSGFLSFIWSRHCRDQSVYPSRYQFPEISEQLTLSDRDLFDLSTRKVYPASNVTIGTVSSYLTFSPFP